MQNLSRQYAPNHSIWRRSRLLRSPLLRLGEKEHVLLLTIHHVVCDGWSLDVLAREVAFIYDAHALGPAFAAPAAADPIRRLRHLALDYMQGEKLELLLGCSWTLAAQSDGF